MGCFKIIRAKVTHSTFVCSRRRVVAVAWSTLRGYLRRQRSEKTHLYFKTRFLFSFAFALIRLFYKKIVLN